MRNLSKSKLVAFRQCPKRLWLEVHKPDLRDDSAATQASFAVGHEVGGIAQRLYDPSGNGVALDIRRDGIEGTIRKTSELLNTHQPIFEAGFSTAGALAFADVLLPDMVADKPVWRMIEVKSSTRLKDYYHDDVAIQSYVARQSGVALASVALAHIDSSFVYPGGGDYRGLLKEHDLTEEAFARNDEVAQWVADAQETVAKQAEPGICTGEHCHTPFECGFIGYCRAQEPCAEIPLDCLPGRYSKLLMQRIEEEPTLDLRNVHDDWLNALQRRVKQHTLDNTVYFDNKGAAEALKAHTLPAHFLDFETIAFAVPIWKGTRPYQQIPFQFSVHRLGRTGKLDDQAFLSLNGDDPSQSFADALVASCGDRGPIFVYNAGFEGARIAELAERFSQLSPALLAIKGRLVDLHPITKAHYYHPDQQGSWSIKSVLPTVAPDLSYQALVGVQDGGGAMEAYLEAIDPATSSTRKAEIEQQLLAYCGLDTFAMVRLWQFLAGRSDLQF